MALPISEENSMPVLRQIAQLGHQVLRRVAEPLVDPADPAVRRLIDDLMATMTDAHGIGIAAPQVYASSALFIMASRPTPRYPHAPVMAPTVVINPEILWVSDELDSGWEGCLSVPGLRGLVPRHRRLRCRYLTRDGRQREEEFSEFLARIFQHEYDHLHGMVFLDRVNSTRDLVTEKEYLKLLESLTT